MASKKPKLLALLLCQDFRHDAATAEISLLNVCLMLLPDKLPQALDNWCVAMHLDVEYPCNIRVDLVDRAKSAKIWSKTHSANGPSMADGTYFTVGKSDPIEITSYGTHAFEVFVNEGFVDERSFRVLRNP